MALSSLAFSAGLATGNPVLMGVGAAGTLLGGILGQGTANKQARIQGQMAGIQNQIFAEQYQTQRDNLLLQRRKMFRQESASLAGSRVAAAASGMSRSSGFSAVQRSIEEQTSSNVGRIDRALASGERLSGLNRQLTDLEAKAAEAQASGGLLQSIFS